MFLIASLFYEGKQIDLRFKSDRLLAGMFSEASPPLPSPPLPSLLYEKSMQKSQFFRHVTVLKLS